MWVIGKMPVMDEGRMVEAEVTGRREGREPPVSGRTQLPEFGDHWETKRLGEIASIRNRKILPSDVAPDTFCVELDRIGQGDGRLLAHSTARHSTASKYRFSAGDILFGRLRSYLRKFWYADRDGICTTEIWPLMVDPVQADSNFLYFIVQSDRFIGAASISYGTHMPRTDWEVMQNFEIHLPPVQEQRAIAEALLDVDGLLGALETLIAKKRAIHQAAMQQLLTGRTRLPGFSGEWEAKRIGDICTFLPTANNPRSDLVEDGNVEYIHYGDIHAHPRPVLDCASDVLPLIEDFRVGNAARLMDGDLVVVDASEDMTGVGKSIEIRGASGRNVVAGLHTIACRGSSDHWAAGFKAYLQFIPAFRAVLAQIATGISVYAISKKQLADIEFPLPPRPEQGAIVSVLSDMDAEIAALERRRDKTRAVKRGMMEQLLTGRVRLA